MAVLKLKGTKQARKRSLGKRSTTVTEVALPEQKSTPCAKLSDYSIFLYGEKKIGKTSLAAQFPDALFLMFEPGGKGLSIYQVPVGTWQEFVAYVDAIEKDKTRRFKTVVIDTVDIAYKLCFDFICKREAIDHPNELNDFGATWGAIASEFKEQLGRLLRLKTGLILLSHAEEREIKSRTGDTFWRMSSTVAKQGRQFLDAVTDIWAYYHYHGSKRYVQLCGDDYVSAGVRPTEHFLTPEGEPVVQVPMGRSPKEGYANIIRAFQNEQTVADPTKKSDSNTKVKLNKRRK